MQFWCFKFGGNQKTLYFCTRKSILKYGKEGVQEKNIR